MMANHSTYVDLQSCFHTGSHSFIVIPLQPETSICTKATHMHTE